jgi:RHS repeat-associated protein
MNVFRSARKLQSALPSSLGDQLLKPSLICIVLGMAFILAFSHPAAMCQGLPGVLPFSTNEYGVDLATGNVNIAFPLRSKSGKIPFWSKVVGTSGMAVSSNFQWQPMLWSYQDPTSPTFDYFAASSRSCSSGNKNMPYYANTLAGFSMTDSTGAVHPFGGLAAKYVVGTGPSSGSCGSGAGTGVILASDGSGYSMSITNGNLIVYDKNGNYWNGSCTYNGGCALTPTYYDPDGATISWSSSGGTVTDSLGTPVVAGVPAPNEYGEVLPSFNSPSISYNDANGNPQQYTFGYTTLNLASSFNCSGIMDFGANNYLGAIQRSMITSISMPGPSPAQYAITYEPTYGMSGYYTGRVASITLPSGGTISYGYSGGNEGLNCAFGTTPTVTVTVNDNNGNIGTYTYTSSLSTTSGIGLPPTLGGTNFTVTKTDPAGNQTVYSFSGEYQTQALYYQGAATGTPIKTVTTCYNGNLTSCAVPSSSPNEPITQTDVYTSFGSSSSDLVQTTYDTYGNVTSEIDMDYGNVGANGQCASATAGVCKLTTTTYGSWNGSGCTALGTIVGVPCDVKVTNNNTGAVLAETRYTYNSAGHPTAVSQWVSGSTWLTTTNSFNSSGTLASTTDPNGNTTQYGYAATGSGGCSGLLLTSTTYALPSVGSSSQTWNCNGGVVTSSTDVNGQPTTYTYNDPLWRQTGTSYPDGGSATTAYNTGASLPWTVSTSTAINANATMTGSTQYDGLGRTTETQVTSDPDGTDTAVTTYDAEGRVLTQSNPHRASPSSTDGTTTHYYDALNRPIKTVEQDGSVLQYCYNGTPATPPVANCSTHLGSVSAGVWVDSTDEATNHWQRSMDSLGRLTEVVEPNGTSKAPTMETDYSYDALNNLLSVNQCGAACPSAGAVVRRFTYDGLSRLLTAANPEAGSTSYTYDGNGNVAAKTSPAVDAASGTQTLGYCYDGMNRMTYKFYSSSFSCTNPSGYAASYSYDASSIPGAANFKSRLTDEKAFIGGTLISERRPYKYDQMGRLAGEQQTPYSPSGASYQFLYGYDLAGNVTCANNGFATASSSSSCSNYAALTPTVGLQYSYDAVGRLQGASAIIQPSSFNAPSILLQANGTSPASYDPMGHLVNAEFGLTSSNGTPAVQLGRLYDSRSRIASESDGSLYSYSVPSGGYAGNGNLLQHTDSVTGTWAFGYDTLNRLTAASASSGIYSGENGSWNYDAFGNRKLESFSPAGGGSTQYTVTTPTAQNQVAGFQYDAAGNVLNDGNNSYWYDAEGRLCAVAYNLIGQTQYTQYLYDAEGRRVGKAAGAGLSCGTPSSTPSNEYLLGLNGEQVTEINGAGAPLHSNVFAGGKLLATYNWADNGLHFPLTDPLGTKRVQVSSAGVPELNCVSLPFGNNLGNTRTSNCFEPSNGASAADATEHHFTGKERDTESGNDYFGARYYASSMGRFMSPDPSQLYFADPTNPQSLNLYSYVLNNPLVNVDPDGRECVWDDGSFDSADDKDTGTQGQCEGAGGHYVDPTAFATLGLGDWSKTPNSTLVGMMGQLQDTQTVTATAAASDLVTSSVDGLVSDFIPTIGPHDLTNLPAISTGDPYRLFSTRYCGPGGAGATTGFLDAACKAHDACYKAAGISAANNGPNGSMTPAQSSAATACNQALYNAARVAANAPGSKAVRYWLTQGANVPFAGTILRPGTEAKPW